MNTEELIVMSEGNHIDKRLRHKPNLELIKKLISAAKGELKSTIIIKDVDVVDVIIGDIREDVNIAIWNDYIVRVGYFDINKYRGEETLIINGKGKVALPGFIDSHIHIESSLLTVQEFARLVVPHGTTAVAADPHEISNVLGIDGIKLFIQESKYTPLRVFFYAPSCVPPTVAGLDTPASQITSNDIKELLEMEEVIGLGEVMDFISVYNADDEILKKIVYTQESGKVVDGHAPQLTEDMLVPYAAVGIEADHESVFLDEALLKLRNGIRIFIREGSAWKDLEELSKLLTRMKVDTRYLTLISDDVEVLELIKEGHIDRILRKAVGLGIDPIKVVQLVTINPAERFGLKELGAILPGRFADVVLVNNLRDFNVDEVFIGGNLVAKRGNYIVKSDKKFRYPERAYKTINIKKPLHPEDFLIKIDSLHASKVKVLVIRAILGKAITKKDMAILEVRDGYVSIGENNDIAYIATVERHKGTGNIGKGFVSGLGLASGAIAQTIAHDVHNIVVAGKNPNDMAKAVNELVRLGGGMVAVNNGALIASVPLPIAGLISDESYEVTASRLLKYIDALKLLNINYRAAYMTLALLSLPVIPEIRITDRGVVDVLAAKIVNPVLEVI
jgi:adenine deaminase